jgi:aminopeptidase
MDQNFQSNLKKYADISVQVGLNLQPGQKLILHHLRYGGVPIQTAPLVRELVASAYQAGASLVDVLWRDDDLKLIRYKHAPRDSFEEYPEWHADAILNVIENGGAMLSVVAFDPDLLDGQDPNLVDLQQRTFYKYWNPISKHISKNTMNWSMISSPIDQWASKVFPDKHKEDQIPALWVALFMVSRVYEEDPVTAWQKHIINLAKRGEYLNQKAYRTLYYKAPGTDLRVGLPEGHVWRSAGFKTAGGIPFTANVPTEEVFTLPDRQLTEGKVRSARPLVYSGNVIDDFSLTFKDGKVVDFSAKQGEQILGNLLKTDDGANMLGEVALVPDSSPISQSGLLFYNTLLDENASCHLALGNAYRFSLEGGEKLSAEEFATKGGNSSLVHVDFMMGSAKLDIDGELPDGKIEPVMRKGEWAFKL